MQRWRLTDLLSHLGFGKATTRNDYKNLMVAVESVIVENCPLQSGNAVVVGKNVMHA